MPFGLDQNVMDNEEECENMVSNLPLLFANGYPTSLDKISESQLEKFIPFMVQCSLGNIQLQNNVEHCEPEWWPNDLEFCVPLKKPPHLEGVWLAKLKEVVAMCYTFHKSVFLLRFCENLALYQPEFLRFINNYNSTTSLFDRISNKLLVTFRNENMLYDQPPVNNKKTLMPRTHSSQSLENNNMVEQSLFDIYLCDNCEAELYSLDAYLEHEKICIIQQDGNDDGDDDDVIFCGEEEYQPIDMAQQQVNFLQNFQLSSTSKSSPSTQQIKYGTPHKRNTQTNLASSSKDIPSVPDKRIRKITRRSTAVVILSKCPVIPISSPAGQQLIKSSNSLVSNEYMKERLERTERFCSAPILGQDSCNRPKFLDKKLNNYNITTFRKPSSYYHYYNFPRRQFSSKSRDEAMARLNSILLKQSNCKPVRISLKRLTTDDIESYQMKTKLNRAKRARKANVIDFIDLCSSDEEQQDDEKAAEVEGSSWKDTQSENMVFTNDYDTNDSNNNGEYLGMFVEESSNEIFINEATNDSYDRFSKLDLQSEYLENGVADNSDQFSLLNSKEIRFMPVECIQNNNNISSLATINNSKKCDSTTNRYGSIVANHRSPLAFLPEKSQDATDDSFSHQNQENTFNYLNGDTDKTARDFLVEKLLDSRIGKEITITKRNAPPTIQTNNFISIDLTL